MYLKHTCSIKKPDFFNTIWKWADFFRICFEIPALSLSSLNLGYMNSPTLQSLVRSEGDLHRFALLPLCQVILGPVPHRLVFGDDLEL